MKTEYVILSVAIVFLVGGVTAFSGIFDEHISDAIFINPAPSSLTGGNAINEVSINLGLEFGYTLLDEHGKNEAVGTTYEEIWENGGVMTLLSSASTMIVTTSGNDNGVSSTGARTVIIEGLNGTYYKIEETITTNAASPVTTSEEFLRVFRIYVDDVGSLNWNENSIDITATDGGSNQGHIQPNEGESEKTQYTIPAFHTGYLLSGYINTDSGKHTVGQLMEKPLDKSWRLVQEVVIKDGIDRFDIQGSDPLEEKTDITWRAKVDQGTAEVVAGYHLIIDHADHVH